MQLFSVDIEDSLLLPLAFAYLKTCYLSTQFS